MNHQNDFIQFVRGLVTYFSYGEALSYERGAPAFAPLCKTLGQPQAGPARTRLGMTLESLL